VNPSVDILVIDDNELQLNYMAELLRSHGYKTDTLQQGARALEVIGQLRPKLIILDIMMPGIYCFKANTG
jgi:CheY-like chemotaxis protein